MISQRIIIPDASFYICFIDDICMPESLIRILQASSFQFVTARIILSEFEKYQQDEIIKEKIVRNLEIFRYYDYGEVLRPFLSKLEIKKGEHEVIVISYIMCFQERDFVAILDDDSPKKLLKQILPKNQDNVIGTIGFIELCTRDYSIFESFEAISLLTLIKNSKFHITDRIIDEAIKRTSETTK